jgi:hypothetical protein
MLKIGPQEPDRTALPVVRGLVPLSNSGLQKNDSTRSPPQVRPLAVEMMRLSSLMAMMPAPPPPWPRTAGHISYAAAIHSSSQNASLGESWAR